MFDAGLGFFSLCLLLLGQLRHANGVGQRSVLLKSGGVLQGPARDIELVVDERPSGRLGGAGDAGAQSAFSDVGHGEVSLIRLHRAPRGLTFMKLLLQFFDRQQSTAPASSK